MAIKELMATKKTETKIDEGILATYDKIIACIPGVERRGASMPYTSYNGNMFSFLASDGSMALRLPALSRDEFIKKHRSRLCEAHGTVLKEYVRVPDKLFRDLAKMKEYFQESFKYVQSLKPKTTRPSKRPDTRNL